MSARPRPATVLPWLAFCAVLLASVVFREGPSPAVDSAIVWLPTGIAIAGLWLLGLRAWWLVALTTIVQRFLLGYHSGVAFSAAAGSTAEAVLGVLVLRRLGFDARVARLRDVAILFAAAAIAPLGSILCSWVGRAFVWEDPNMPFYSGWDGWWRMNALGALTVVPLALTWLPIPRREWTPRFVLGTLVALVGVPALLVATMALVPQGAIGVVAVNLVLAPLVLYAAGRHGMRGATLAGALAVLTVAMYTTHGHGPFLELPRSQRHVALQLFDLAFVAIPPAFGALIAERRSALEGSARSDELRRTIQQALPDVTYRMRRDGTVIEVTMPVGSQMPFTATAIVGHSIFEFVDPAAVERIRRAIDEAHRTGEPTTTEYELDLGGTRLVREARYAAHGADEVLSVVRDITDRRWDERTAVFEAGVLELVAEHRPAAAVFAAIVAGIESLVPGSRCSVVLVRDGCLHVALGASLPEAYNAAIEGVPIGPETGSCGAAAATGRTVVVRDIGTDPLWAPYRHLALPHDLRACWSVPIRESDGTVRGTFAVYHATVRGPSARELAIAERAAVLAGFVVERERSGDELRRSQELLASINRNVREGLFRVTPDLRVVYANLAFARALGFEAPDTVVGRTLAEAFLESGRSDALVRQAREQGQWPGEEVHLRRADGRPFWAMLTGTAVRAESGEILHIDGALADVTARKGLEEQLRQSQKMEAVGKLAGGVAHDFNNLLTVIIGHAESLRSGPDDDVAARSHAEQVLDAARRASGLTRQLLAYSRQQVLSPQVLDLNLVVDQMAEMLRRLIGEDVHLAVVHDDGACWVRVDPSQIEQVLLNLVVNARDAMPDGGTLTVSTAIAHADAARAAALGEFGAGPCVLLGVRDTGVGMSPEVMARAFDPFFTTKRPGKGTGLGLSTVYGIVKQSGGAVWLESAPGGGTVVWIGLPLSAAPAAVAPDVAPAPAASRSGTVLVVEDEAGVRSLVCRLLQRQGFDVLEATDGEAGIAAARAHVGPLDLVVTDVVMPRMGGREMAALLRAERPALRFLFISGYPDDARAPGDLAGAAGAFLAKPFATTQLLERVRELLPAGATRA